LECLLAPARGISSSRWSATEVSRFARRASTLCLPMCNTRTITASAAVNMRRNPCATPSMSSQTSQPASVSATRKSWARTW
jgi:hypothetical protein